MRGGPRRVGANATGGSCHRTASARHSFPAVRLPRISLRRAGREMRGGDQRFRASKVLQASGLPVSYPALNQRERCSLVPCVKLSGDT